MRNHKLKAWWRRTLCRILGHDWRAFNHVLRVPRFTTTHVCHRCGRMETR